MRIFRRKRAGIAMLGALSLLGLASPAVKAQTTLPITAPPPPPLTWAPCTFNSALDCSTLTVPLDYAAPSQGTTNLNVMRARATGSAIGTLIFNPGGPGLTATDFLQFGNIAHFATPLLASRFDLVAFDPRGTTNGIVCMTTTAQQNQYWEVLNHLPRTIPAINTLLAAEQQVNQGCSANNQPLINHLDTASTVRDLEQLRRAMGLTTFTYVGQSYGTFIGYRYAKLYPGHLRAMVLDAVEDHSISSEQNFQEGNVAYDLLWQNFEYWCQQPANHCSLIGQDIDAVLDQALAKARVSPIPAPRSQSTQVPVNDWELTLGLQELFSFGNIFFSTVDEIIHDASNNDASLARELYDTNVGYPPNGFPRDNEAHRATFCVDQTWSQSIRTAGDIQSLVTQAKALAPRFGEAGVFQGPSQCFNYPVAPVEPPPLATTVTGQPMLLVAGTFDASTPITGALRMASHLTGSSLLIRNGYGHVSYDKSTCVQQTVDNYLINLTLPANGTVCSTDLWPIQPPLTP